MGQLNNQDLEHTDIAAVIGGIQQNGVISGLAVSESASPGMSVLVSSGSCRVSNTNYTEASGQNLNIAAADVTHPRKDIVIYDTSAGNPAIVTGTPAAAPIPPDIPSGDIYLAIVHIAANETTIANADIDDGRVYTQYHHTSHETGGVDEISFDFTMTNQTGSRALNTNYQNTGSKSMFCMVTIVQGGTACEFAAYVKSSSPADVSVAEEAAYATGDCGELFFIVPAGYYYRVDKTSGTANIQHWYEYTL